MAQVRWISVKAGVAQQRQNIMRLSGAGLLVAMIGLIATVYFQFGPHSPKFHGVWIFVAGALFALWLLASKPPLLGARYEGYRLGASDSEAFFENAQNLVNMSGPTAGHAPWSRVFFDDDRMLIGDQVIPLREYLKYSWGDLLFDKDELVRVILSHVPRENIDRKDVIEAYLDAGQKWTIVAIVSLPIAAAIAWFLLSRYL